MLNYVNDPKRWLYYLQSPPVDYNYFSDLIALLSNELKFLLCNSLFEDKYLLTTAKRSGQIIHRIVIDVLPCLSRKESL